MNYSRDYTCVKKFENDYILCSQGINYLSETESYEFYKIIKVPHVESHGIEGLIFGTSIYDKMYIKEKLKNLLKINPGYNSKEFKVIFK